MQHKRRSIGFILTTLCTFTLLLVACHVGPSPTRTRTTQNNAKLTLRETPAILHTATAGSTTTTPEVYIGEVPAEHAWVGLSATGKRIVAFVTDGSKDHQPT